MQQHNVRRITAADLYEDGLIGSQNSAERRNAFKRLLSLPERLSSPSLLKVLNSIMTYEQYRAMVDALLQQEN